jgi:hypothetical protein
LPDDISAIQRSAAQVTHWALYALLIVQPLVGWIATSASPSPITVFWLFELPPLWHEDRRLSDQLFLVHAWIATAIVCLAAAHIGAALHHHFVRKDRVLMGMITGLLPGQGHSRIHLVGTLARLLLVGIKLSSWAKRRFCGVPLRNRSLRIRGAPG